MSKSLRRHRQASYVHCYVEDALNKRLRFEAEWVESRPSYL